MTTWHNYMEVQFNGRTLDFDSNGVGSIPTTSAKKKSNFKQINKKGEKTANGCFKNWHFCLNRFKRNKFM